MSDLQEVLRRLPGLTPAELEQVRVRVLFLVGSKPAAPVEDWLQSGILSELKRRGIWAQGHSIDSYVKGHAEASLAARQHILGGYRNRLPRRAELLALGQLAANALAEWLLRAKVPLGPKTMFNNLNKIPAALEDAFPGYWQAGMLGTCLEKRGVYL